MPHRKGVSTQALAACFRLLSHSAREREMEFGRDNYRACPVGFSHTATFDTLEKAVLWLLQEGVPTARIYHHRGWVQVAQLDFAREGFTDA